MSEERMEAPKAYKRRLYNADYREHLEDTDTPDTDPASAGSTSEKDPDPEENSWKKRYGDLRSHTSHQVDTLTERITTLEAQLQAASQKEVRIPSTQGELEQFMQKYPDVYRHIRSIAMTELLNEKQNLKSETEQVKEVLARTNKELGLAKILKAHPDFHDINGSREFQEWSELQPQQIQDWLFHSDDPMLCIKALDFYKLETNYNKPKKEAVKRPTGADMQVTTPKSKPEVGDGNKRVWKASEIGKMHPREYEKLEDEIDLARMEGRFDPDA